MIIKLIHNLVQRILHKIARLYQLVVETPHWGLIISLSVISGILSFLGIPILIPILEMMQGQDGGATSSIVEIIRHLFNFVGLEPSFYPMLSVAAVLILFGELLVIISTLVALYASYNLITHYSKKLFSSYLNVDWSWLSSTHSGEINYVVLREAQLAASCHLCAQRFLISLVQCVAYFYIAMLLSVKSVLLAIVVYSFLMIANIYNARAVKHLTTGINNLFKKSSNLLNGMQQNKKFLKTSLMNKPFISKISQDIETINNEYKKVGLRMQGQKGWNFTFMFLYLILLIVFHEQLGLNYSSILVLILVFNRLSPQFNMVSTNYAQLNHYLPMHESVVRKLEDMEEHQEKQAGEAFKGKGLIAFDHVSFSYPNGHEVLKDINLEISSSRSIAIVGGSGTGKTTLLDLIIGLWKPSQGTIYYGDIAHDRLNYESLRRQVAYISQDTTLFDGTIKENLTVGKPEATEEEIGQICEKVHLDKFVNQLSDGLDTRIGENGIKLSGGQKQRLVLGRALFMNPKILILDEATSELDSESEQLIQQTILDLSKELTIIIVAHRLSTVRFADIVYVLDGGTIVESGSYSELLEKKGRLYQLDALQK